MRHHLRTALTVVAVVVSIGSLGARPRAPRLGIVSVTGGRVTGVPARNEALTVFRGIPFAAPPVGPLRWRAPEPVRPWAGVLRADAFSPSCIQSMVQERKPWTYEFMTHGEISEDCLYVNVWTPAAASSERRPVFVYLYGGANTEGSAVVPVYDGEGLASKGLVVVTFNYRVGVLGFFSHPTLSQEAPYHGSGNYGLLDQIAAVRWVSQNIASFGGDPARVTIAGQSAGAQGVHNLTISPLSKGLFQRAIAESGSTLGAVGGGRSLADQEADGVRFATMKGNASLATLRAMSWAEVVAPVQAPAPAGGGRGPAAPRFGVVIDNYALTAAMRDVYAAGRQHDVPTLTGSNADENGAVPSPTITLEAYKAQAQQRYAAASDEFLRLYPAATDDEARAMSNASARDQARTSTYLWAMARSATAKTAAYTYFFNQPLPGPDVKQYGAFHTSEVPYVLNTLAMSDRPFTAVDRKVAETLSSYWVNFATRGNPNGPGLPAWPAISKDAPHAMQLGADVKPIPVATNSEKLAFWSKFLNR